MAELSRRQNASAGGGPPPLKVSRALQDAGTSLQRQLCAQLREQIASGLLAPGARLPSARALSARLRVSRNTVDGALQRLRDEGLLVRRVGDGTVVAGGAANSERSDGAD